MPSRGKREITEEREYSAQWDEADQCLHVSRSVRTVVTTGRGREWQQGETQYDRDWLVLPLADVQSLVGAMLRGLTYWVGDVTKAGVAILPYTAEIAWPGKHRRFMVLTSAQGTAMAEAALCPAHDSNVYQQEIAKRVAARTDDSSPGGWVHTSENTELQCAICGAPLVHPGGTQ